MPSLSPNRDFRRHIAFVCCNILTLVCSQETGNLVFFRSFFQRVTLFLRLAPNPPDYFVNAVAPNCGVGLNYRGGFPRASYHLVGGGAPKPPM